MKNKISFKFKHGSVDGIYVKASGSNAPLVIVTNGHNGFYNYGMFPYIQEYLSQNGISSYSYNFSHGGVVGDNDYFTELGLYKKNCMRFETEDLREIVKNLKHSQIEFSEENKLYLLSHSLGSVPTIFATKTLLSEGYKINGTILIAPTMTLDIWSHDEMKEWEKNNVLMLNNKRTNQYLPQGKEFLEETKQAKGVWSIKQALKDTHIKYLLLHGKNDEAIPVVVSETINEWNKKYGNISELKIIPNATHTFNTKHPFEKPSNELNSMLKIITGWIN